MLRAFVSKHLMYENGSFISCEEIRDVFCTINISDTTDSAAFYALLKVWAESMDMVRNTKRRFPSRKATRQYRGYANLAWRPSPELAAVVNGIRAQYVDRDLFGCPDVAVL